MTTIELDEVALDAPRAGWLSRLIARWKRRRAERMTLQSLSHLDARLLRDMGIEPMDVMRALNGTNWSSLFDSARRGGKH